MDSPDIVNTDKLFHILEGVVAFLAGADLDHVLHIVDENLPVADMAGVEHLLGGLNDGAHGNLADHHVHLNLGQQVGLNGDAAVVFRLAALPPWTPQPSTWDTVMPVMPSLVSAALEQITSKSFWAWRRFRLSWGKKNIPTP